MEWLFIAVLISTQSLTPVTTRVRELLVEIRVLLIHIFRLNSIVAIMPTLYTTSLSY